ncbi:MAG: hypothetical protein KDK97_19000, partial [Verrucomicrobiales bacterium]|nr:hypothetical protein [Verrucomicrobiales bacterium]
MKALCPITLLRNEAPLALPGDIQHSGQRVKHGMSLALVLVAAVLLFLGGLYWTKSSRDVVT